MRLLRASSNNSLEDALEEKRRWSTTGVHDEGAVKAVEVEDEVILQHPSKLLPLLTQLCPRATATSPTPSEPSTTSSASIRRHLLLPLIAASHTQAAALCTWRMVSHTRPFPTPSLLTR